jgi:hypothetical protein
VGRIPLLTRFSVERIALAVGVIAFFIIGYFGIGMSVDPLRAHDLTTTLDRRIPFVASAIWVYFAMFPAAVSPLFLVSCPRLYRRTVAAYAAAIAVSLVLFALLPVTSAGLRVSDATLTSGDLSRRAVALLYRLDPPLNLFPSLHFSIAALAAFATWKAGRVGGIAAVCGVTAIGLSICAVKQHFVLDAAAGLVLSGAIYAIVLRSYAPNLGAR